MTDKELYAHNMVMKLLKEARLKAVSEEDKENIDFASDYINSAVRELQRKEKPWAYCDYCDVGTDKIAGLLELMAIDIVTNRCERCLLDCVDHNICGCVSKVISEYKNDAGIIEKE